MHRLKTALKKRQKRGKVIVTEEYLKGLCRTHNLDFNESKDFLLQKQTLRKFAKNSKGFPYRFNWT
jgi:hypothetical protein